MSIRTVGTPVLRRLNTALVLDAVRLAAPHAQRIAEIVATTGLTRPTVAQAVEDLLAENLLRSAGTSPSGGAGRPAARVQLNDLAAPVVGIDLGIHSVAVAVADLAGRQVALVREPVERRDGTGVEAMFAAARQALTRALHDAGVTASGVAGVTVGSPGIVDGERGAMVLADASGLLTTVDVRDRLQPLFTCMIQLENNANLAATAIYAAQRPRPQTLLAVQWGERLGAGIVIGGQLHRGASSSAGEIAYVNPPGRSQPVGADVPGPLEASIGAAGIVARARAAAEVDADSVLRQRLRTDSGAAEAPLVFAAAAQGDATAVRVVDEVAASFAAAIAPIVLALNPDALVIGGGIARAGQQLTAAIQRHLDELTLHSPRVELSTLAQDAVITGATTVAHDELWRRLLSRDYDRGPFVQAGEPGST